MNSSTILAHDYRPRDFSARLRRDRVRSLGAIKAPRHYGRRAMLAGAAIALPAFAAPVEWGVDATIAEAPRHGASPISFERPAHGFPGAAFHHLADGPASLPLGRGIHADAEPITATASPPGPAARAMRIDNSGVDRARALHCLTAAIYYEAASEADAGQRAVAQVVLNRVAHPSYPSTICGVVYQGSERATGCQFSFTCDGALSRRPSRMFWLRAENVARQALAGFVYSAVGLATHYHTVAIHPYWADSLNYLGTIGAHRFYRFKGPAGQPGTFRFAYLGGEPVAGPRPRDAQAGAAEAAPDPVAIQRAYEAGLAAARHTAFQPASGDTGGSARPTPPPIYATELQRRGGDALYRADNLPGTTAVMPEYEHSGRWIGQPGA